MQQEIIKLMPLILSIENATPICSVALHMDGELLAFKEENLQNTQAELITLYIDEVLKDAGKTYKDLDAIAVGKGPGSYTGLRIGVSTAKGLCFSLDIPLIAINTLEGMAAGAIEFGEVKENSLLCPMIDARRMEVYCAIFDQKLTNVSLTSPVIIEETSFENFFANNFVTLFGNGADKCKEVLKTDKALYIDIEPSARYFGKLALDAYNNKTFEDVAYFEPFYLKDFIATKPKKLL